MYSQKIGKITFPSNDPGHKKLKRQKSCALAMPARKLRGFDACSFSLVVRSFGLYQSVSKVVVKQACK